MPDKRFLLMYPAAGSFYVFHGTPGILFDLTGMKIFLQFPGKDFDFSRM
jgi:hypothetical protein